jgi:hypothetical protein
MMIPELQKPMGEWCGFAQIGKGCSCYDTRPDSCRKFRCLWLDSQMPEDLRPDQSKIVLTAEHGAALNGNLVDTSRQVTYIVGYLDPTTPACGERGLPGRFLRQIRGESDIIIVRGQERTLLPKTGA